MAVALPGDVVIDHYAKDGGDGVLVRAVVVVDVKRRLRLEVIDQLERFDEAALRAFALDVFAPGLTAETGAKTG